MMKSIKAEAAMIVLLVVALIGGGLFVAKPKWLSKESKRAKASTEATAVLDTATIKADEAAKAQAASAAAGVATIGIANSMAPESPSKSFIQQEVPAVLAKLPTPDPIALLEAEKRRSAVMEGRAQEARSLYEQEAKKSADLQHERDLALAARDAAQEARRKADVAISEAAAANLATERQRNGAILIVGLLAALWIYTKFFSSISLANLGKAAADIRAGADPIQALTDVTAPWHYAQVQKAAKLATNLSDTTTQTKV